METALTRSGRGRPLCPGRTFSLAPQAHHVALGRGPEETAVLAAELRRALVADAKRLGADRIVLSTDERQMAAVAGNFHLIVDTVPYVHDLNPYIPTLAVKGKLVLVGYLGPLEPALNSMPMVMGGKSVAGSLIGGIAATQELLDFCGEHGIVSDVEMIRMNEINAAYERMLKSDVKYRFVIDMASLKEEA